MISRRNFLKLVARGALGLAMSGCATLRLEDRLNFKVPKSNPLLIADFVHDSSAAKFAQDILSQYENREEMSNIEKAEIIYYALAAYGIKYGPNRFDEEDSKDSEYWQGIQPGWLTLERKEGDCEDLAILYAAALRGIGIETYLVDSANWEEYLENQGKSYFKISDKPRPSALHTYVIFDTGYTREEAETHLPKGLNDVIIRGESYLPIELTNLRSISFEKALEVGSELMKRDQINRQANFYIEEGRDKYSKDKTFPAPSREEIERAKVCLTTGKRCESEIDRMNRMWDAIIY